MALNYVYMYFGICEVYMNLLCGNFVIMKSKSMTCNMVIYTTYIHAYTYI